MRAGRLVCSLIVLVLLAGEAMAQFSPRKDYVWARDISVAADPTITLDGLLDEAVWAQAESLAIEANEAGLRTYRLGEDFDVIVSIGLLMFLDCPTAFRCLEELKQRVRPGGKAIVNVLIEGTTYMEMFDPSFHCLFSRDELQRRFSGWEK